MTEVNFLKVIDVLPAKLKRDSLYFVYKTTNDKFDIYLTDSQKNPKALNASTSGGAPVWGAITGSLPNQLDLKTALDILTAANAATAAAIPTNNNQLANGNGYITGITGANVVSALGYTPYNASNPQGYINAVPAQSFASLTGKPTSLAGYGITDAYPLASNPAGYLTAVPAQSFASLSGKPTSIAGYGITDTVSQAITGYASGAGVVAASDSIVGAIGKLNGNIAGKQATITTGTNLQYFKGDLSLGTFPTNVSSFSNDSAYLTAITSGQVTTALGFTPVTNARTISTTSPLLGGGDLTANRTLSWDFTIANTFTASQIIVKTALAATTVAALSLNNTTAAINGTQQTSPSLSLGGFGWGTTASTSQAVVFQQSVLPVQSTVPTGTWNLAASIAGGAFANVFSVNSAGNITLGAGATITNASVNIASAGGGGAGNIFVQRLINGNSAVNINQTANTVNITSGSSGTGIFKAGTAGNANQICIIGTGEVAFGVVPTAVKGYIQIPAGVAGNAQMAFATGSVAPTGTSLVEGVIWYDSTAHAFKGFDGTTTKTFTWA